MVSIPITIRTAAEMTRPSGLVGSSLRTCSPSRYASIQPSASMSAQPSCTWASTELGLAPTATRAASTIGLGFGCRSGGTPGAAPPTVPGAGVAPAWGATPWVVPQGRKSPPVAMPFSGRTPALSWSPQSTAPSKATTVAPTSPPRSSALKKPRFGVATGASTGGVVVGGAVAASAGVASTPASAFSTSAARRSSTTRCPAASGPRRSPMSSRSRSCSYSAVFWATRSARRSSPSALGGRRLGTRSQREDHAPDDAYEGHDDSRDPVDLRHLIAPAALVRSRGLLLLLPAWRLPPLERGAPRCRACSSGSQRRTRGQPRTWPGGAATR